MSSTWKSEKISSARRLAIFLLLLGYGVPSQTITTSILAQTTRAASNRSLVEGHSAFLFGGASAAALMRQVGAFTHNFDGACSRPSFIDSLNQRYSSSALSLASFRRHRRPVPPRRAFGGACILTQDHATTIVNRDAAKIGNNGGGRWLMMGRRRTSGGGRAAGGGSSSSTQKRAPSLEFPEHGRDEQQTERQRQRSPQSPPQQQQQQQQPQPRKTSTTRRKQSSNTPSSTSSTRKTPRKLWGQSTKRRGTTTTTRTSAASSDRMRLEEEEEGTRKMRRTRGKPLIIACDAESITHPELLECIDIIEDPSARDIGMIYNDWSKNPSWRSYMYQFSKADRFSSVQRDPVPPGSNALGDDTMTVDIMKMASSDMYQNHDFCLISSTESMADLAARLRAAGRRVIGVGRRQAPGKFLKSCDAFIHIDPANRYELLMDEGLVMSVALCVALAAFGQDQCEWVRMRTIVNSLHSWDLGLEDPNSYGYSGYDEVIDAMDIYVQGVEDTSGEIVLKVPPNPGKEIPPGLDEVARYLYHKWVWFTADSQMNDILLGCIPACVQAVATARSEVKTAVNSFESQDYASNP